ncbi:MAG: nucleotidyltransferase family protein [Patescibacteria group bacterium]
MNSAKITKAIILSAGLGTRLRPLTEGIPKVMVPILGKPLLLHHIEQLKKHRVTDIFINLHYLPDVITDYFGDGSKFGVNITYKLETPIILGTAGGIKSFEEKIQDNFFVVYGDVFSLLDYSKMANYFFTKKDAIAVSVVGDTDHPKDSDLVEMGDNGKFIKLYPKPHSVLPLQYKSLKAGFIFSPKIFKFIPKGIYSEIDHELLPNLLKAGEKVYGYELQEYMKDIGTIERYKEVEAFLRNQ